MIAVPRAASARGARRARPCATRSMPRVGSSRQRTAGRSPWSTMAIASRWRSPPERSRGWRSASLSSLACGERLRRQLVPDPLVERRSRPGAGAQRDATGAFTFPRVGGEQPRGDLPAASTSRRRCGPSARRARRRGPRRSTPRSTAAPPSRSNHAPLSASATSPSGALAPSGTLAVGSPRHPRSSRPRAPGGRPHAHRERAQAGEREEPGARRLQLRRVLARPLEERGGRRVAGHRAVAHSNTYRVQAPAAAYCYSIAFPVGSCACQKVLSFETGWRFSRIFDG